jgi:hypothetical protein
MRICLVVAVASLLVAAPAMAQGGGGQDAPDSVEARIVALERAAMDSSDAADGGEAFLGLSSEDVVYMDPTLDKPIHGLSALTAYYRSAPRGTPTRGRMANVNVQVAGDAAVLTYNYLHRRNWNVTEVYRRTPAGWRIIHSHFSYLKP